jgi:putative ABC transport system substrate-binding protein
MRELGYVEGRDYVIEWCCADGRLERFADFATGLVRLNVDVFVLGTPTAVPAVRQATNTIPVVMGYSTDPVGSGFITGLASSQDDAAPRQLELLMTTVPDLSRVILLVDPSSPNSRPIIRNAQAAAQKVGLDLVRMEIRKVQEIESTFATLQC